MTPLVVAGAALLGLVIGSFLNVAAVRVPARVSVLPRSACPQCAHALAWYDLVPLVSYGTLGGRCRHCEARVSVQYPVVEGLAALAFAAAAWRAPGLSADGAATGVLWAGCAAVGLAALIATTVTDLRHGVVPDRITLPAAVLALGLLLVFAPEWLPSRLAAAAAAGAAALALRWVGTLAFGRPGLGLGDAKLLSVLGLAVGGYALWVFYLGILVGGVVGGLGIATGRLARTDALPFVPSLAAGAALWLLFWPHGPFP